MGNTRNTGRSSVRTNGSRIQTSRFHNRNTLRSSLMSEYRTTWMEPPPSTTHPSGLENIRSVFTTRRLRSRTLPSTVTSSRTPPLHQLLNRSLNLNPRSWRRLRNLMMKRGRKRRRRKRKKRKRRRKRRRRERSLSKRRHQSKQRMRWTRKKRELSLPRKRRKRRSLWRRLLLRLRKRNKKRRELPHHQRRRRRKLPPHSLLQRLKRRRRKSQRSSVHLHLKRRKHLHLLALIQR